MSIALKLTRAPAPIGLLLCLACTSDASNGPKLPPPGDSRTSTFFQPITSEVPPEVLAHPSDWPLPHADYDNTRRAAASGIDAEHVSQLHELWRMPVGSATSAPFGRITGNPLVLGDTLYMQDTASDVYAVARDTGELRWKQQVGRPAAGPNGVAVGWGGVFAPAGDDTLLALNNADGANFAMITINASRAFGAQPIPYGKKLFVGLVPGSKAAAKGGAVVAFSMRLPFPKWDFQMPAPDDAAANGGGVWYPGLIDQERGVGYWGSGNALAWPGLKGATSDDARAGMLVALELEKGTLRWSYREDAGNADFQNSPLHVRADADRGIEELVIGSGKTGTVVALEPEHGELRWRVNVGADEDSARQSGVLTASAYADGVLYVPVAALESDATDLAAGSGALVALDVRDGHELWRSDLPAPCYSAATLANDLVFTAAANGNVYAFERTTGREAWHFEAPGGINAPLVIAGDALFISVAHGAPELIALGL